MCLNNWEIATDISAYVVNGVEFELMFNIGTTISTPNNRELAVIDKDIIHISYQ